MKTHVFDTKRDALAAGYEPAKPRILKQTDELFVRIIDTSGGNLFGYDYSVVADIEIPGKPYETKHFAESVTVWLEKDLNNIGGHPCFTVMFEPGIIQKAIEAAEKWVAEIRNNPRQSVQSDCIL